MTQRAPKNLNTSINRTSRVENSPHHESEPVRHSLTASSVYDLDLSDIEENDSKTSSAKKRPSKSSAKSSSSHKKSTASHVSSDTGRTSKASKSKKKKTSIVSIIIIVVAAGVFIFAAIKLISALTTYSTAATKAEEVREIFKVKENTNATKATEIVTNEEGSTVVQEVEWVFDYDKLLALNSDAIGYLKMQGDGDNIVDYPVVQGSDNDYYLDHLFDGTYNNSGAIFMDCNAVDGFDSSYAIIYGHNMKSGARMFGCLGNYRDYSYFEQHMYWDVYTGYEKHVYRTFAAFETSVDSFVYDYYSSDYIVNLAEGALNSSEYDMGLTIDDFSYDSKILCLSTCLDNYSEYYRYVVFIVRVS